MDEKFADNFISLFVQQNNKQLSNERLKEPTMATKEKKEKKETALKIVRYSDRPKKKLTAKERERAIKEISASIKKSFSKKYLQDWLK